MRFSRLAAIAAVALGASASADASTLNMYLATDNVFSVYLSTDDSVLGTPIGTGNDWKTTSHFTAPLTGTAPYYIHIVGQNLGTYSSGNPAALIGSFSIDSGYTFSNGTALLSTDTTHWSALNSATGAWVLPSGSAQSLGTNGGSNIWTNNRPGAETDISLSAAWIWSSTASSQYALFSTEITPTPLPPAWIMMLGGLLGFGFLGYRKRTLASLVLTPA